MVALPAPADRRSRLAGVLLGTAVGDALGLPAEGMSPEAVARHLPTLDRYRLFGRTGFVSDDTEQAALVAHCLVAARDDRERFVRLFRKMLLRWFLRLPWGIGLGTLRACLRIALGLRTTGTSSAGNGAAMRAAIVGVYFASDTKRRHEWSDALATVTHLDARAVEGARYVAEVAAIASRVDAPTSRTEIVAEAMGCITNEELRAAIARALTLRADTSAPTAGRTLGNTGFVVHTVALATFLFVRFGASPREAIAAAVHAGGDTDSIAAIVGAWVGALHGEAGLPRHLVEALHGQTAGALTPLAGATHLRALAGALADTTRPVPRFSAARAAAQNIVLFPVVLAHALRVVASRGHRAPARRQAT